MSETPDLDIKRYGILEMIPNLCAAFLELRNYEKTEPIPFPIDLFILDWISMKIERLFNTLIHYFLF